MAALLMDEKVSYFSLKIFLRNKKNTAGYHPGPVMASSSEGATLELLMSLTSND